MKYRHYQVPLFLSLIVIALSFPPTVVAQERALQRLPAKSSTPHCALLTLAPSMSW